MRVDRQTEARRLAHVLHQPEHELDYLAPLDGVGLMQLRRHVNAMLLARFEPTFKRIAAGGKLAPDAMVAKLCTKFFGPRITANMAYYTPEARATRLGARFDAEFLTAVTRELIPEKAEPMLNHQPLDLMRPVTANLLAAREYYTMGGFVDFMPFDKLLALMDYVGDPEASLRICSFAQRKDRIAELVEHFSDLQVREFITTAHTEPQLLEEIMRIAAEMSPEMLQRQHRITQSLGEDYVARSRETAEALGLRSQLKPLFG